MRLPGMPMLPGAQFYDPDRHYHFDPTGSYRPRRTWKAEAEARPPRGAMERMEELVGSMDPWDFGSHPKVSTSRLEFAAHWTDSGSSSAKPTGAMPFSP